MHFNISKITLIQFSKNLWSTTTLTSAPTIHNQLYYHSQWLYSKADCEPAAAWHGVTGTGCSVAKALPKICQSSFPTSSSLIWKEKASADEVPEEALCFLSIFLSIAQLLTWCRRQMWNPNKPEVSSSRLLLSFHSAFIRLRSGHEDYFFTIQKVQQ